VLATPFSFSADKENLSGSEEPFPSLVLSSALVPILRAIKSFDYVNYRFKNNQDLEIRGIVGGMGSFLRLHGMIRMSSTVGQKHL
jgi:hypothetical protein